MRLNKVDFFTQAIHYTLKAAFLTTALFGAWLLLFRLNLQQIDLAGHMASAFDFEKGLFHKFNDRIFLGYVHGLFYPPLQDFLVSAIHRLSPGQDLGSWIFAFKSYLLLCWLGYMAAIYRFSTGFRSLAAKSFFLFALLWLLHMEKGQLLYYQGMSLFDLWRVGLSSQILGGTFLFLVFYELNKSKSNVFVLTLCYSLLVLSHLVVALYCFLVSAVFLLLFCFRRDKTQIKTLLISGSLASVLSSFFWFPFISNASFMTSAHITSGGIVGLVVLGIGFLALIFKKDFAKLSTVQGFVLSTSLLAITLGLESRYPVGDSIFPRMHYYRFVVYVLIGLIVSSALVVEYRRQISKMALVFPAGLLIYMVTQLPLVDYNFQKKSLQQTQLEDLGSNPEKLQALFNNGRTFTLDTERAIDFGLDSLLGVALPNYKSVKGLYWESTKTNILLSSYLANIFSNPVVLQPVSLGDLSCSERSCLLDHLIYDYGVEHFTVAPYSDLAYMSYPVFRCLKKLLATGQSSAHLFERSGDFRFNRKLYSVYNVSKKMNSTFYSSPVYFQYAKNTQGEEWIRNYLSKIKSNCRKKQSKRSVLLASPSKPSPINDFYQWKRESLVPKKYRSSAVSENTPTGLNFVKVEKQSIAERNF